MLGKSKVEVMNLPYHRDIWGSKRTTPERERDILDPVIRWT
jgi:hypothetical protein